MTTSRWHSVKLGEVLTKSIELVDLDPLERYKQVTIRLWGKGVVERGEKLGSQIASTRQARIRAGQFILSRIDARNGAMGIVPRELDGAVVSNDFPTFDVRLDSLRPEYLGWLSRTSQFVHLCSQSSEGTTNRVRLRENQFLSLPVSIPAIDQQLRVVTQIDEVAARIQRSKDVSEQSLLCLQSMLAGNFRNKIEGVEWRPLQDVAPLVRRPIRLDGSSEYPELGIRSFGKGTFHKPAVLGAALGSKRLFTIRSGDLVFNNVFAWEGAVAVAQPDDDGRVGSHRFITCVPHPNVATATFLRYYFLTDEGLRKLGEASPGGAGRNRTLGLKSLGNIPVPVPPMEIQLRFDLLQAAVGAMGQLRQQQREQIDAILPSLLNRVFTAEL